jgi:hypothetical protein
MTPIEDHLKKRPLKNFILKYAVASVFSVVLGVGLAFVWFFTMMPPSTKPVVTDSKDKDAVKILFVGNSFTNTNMLPATLAEFIRVGLHKSTKIYQACLPGQTLNGHWKIGAVQRIIAERGPWDYVVLQGASSEPLRGPSILCDYAKRFDVVIKAAHAKTVLFETWADKSDRQSQRVITETYNELGKQLGASVIPVGESYFGFQDRDSDLNLYSEDNHHPSQAGTYLAACMFYSYLFDKDPHELPSKIVFRDIDTKKDYTVIDLEPRQTGELQACAWACHSDSNKSKAQP